MRLALMLLAACTFEARVEVCDFVDNDNDGSIDEGFDSDGDGYLRCASSPQEVDCNDLNSNVHPHAAEICDGLDNDCDGEVPAHEQDLDEDGQRVCDGDCDDNDARVNGLDLDFDGVSTCTEPTPDCDDFEPAVFPGAVEACNGRDDDCSGQVDVEELDDDGDGQRACAGDCDDGDALRNGFDVDADGISSCAQPQPDCDDRDPRRRPGFPETCDGLDNDCDGVPNASEADADADGVRICGGDCADADPSTYRGAPELCDGKDNDCDGLLPLDERDQDADGQRACDGDCADLDPTVDGNDRDGDGQSGCAGDCDDTRPSVYLGAPERCDLLDTDCDGTTRSDELDLDGDGQPECDDRDCDDLDPRVYATAPEVCDGVDNDCSGTLSSDEEDRDGDGYLPCAPGTPLHDCNDDESSIHPRAQDICNQVDDDCDNMVDFFSYYLDGDNDGVGTSYTVTISRCSEAWSGPDYCYLTSGGAQLCWSLVDGDCDDSDRRVGLEADERCNNGIDDDCDGRTDEPPCQ